MQIRSVLVRAVDPALLVAGALLDGRDGRWVPPVAQRRRQRDPREERLASKKAARTSGGLCVRRPMAAHICVGTGEASPEGMLTAEMRTRALYRQRSQPHSCPRSSGLRARCNSAASTHLNRRRQDFLAVCAARLSGGVRTADCGPSPVLRLVHFHAPCQLPRIHSDVTIDWAT